MHFDASFGVFLSFLIFVVLAVKYFKKPIVSLLDHMIQDVSDELRSSEQVLQNAQDKYHEISRRNRHIADEVRHLQVRSEEDLHALKERSEHDFQEVLSHKQKSFEARIANLYRERLEAVRVEFIGMVIENFRSKIHELSAEDHSNYNDQLISKIAV